MSGPLVSAAELSAALGRVTLLDVRWAMGAPGGPALRGDHLSGHLPGAVYVDLDHELADPPGARGRHPLPDPERFGEAMRRLGVRHDRPVVVYDDWQGRAAARAWWLLRHHGHGRVRVLDGGLTAWRDAGGAVEAGEVRAAPGDFVPVVPGLMPTLAADDLGAVDVLLDARAPERFRGEHEPVDPVAGHVPGAVNLPTEENLDAGGRFRPVEELRRRYRAAGVGPGREVAVYCGSGVTAVHDVLALELLGVRAALYPGSWSEWVGDPSRAVTRGP